MYNGTLPNPNNLLNFVCAVSTCTHDEHTVKKVDGQAVRTTELCSSYPGHPTVRSHDDQWSQVILKGTVEEGEAFYVQHVNFVNEKDLIPTQLVSSALNFDR